MSSGLRDEDFDLEEMKGQVSNKNKAPASQPSNDLEDLLSFLKPGKETPSTPVVAVVDPVVKDDSYEAVVKRLDEHCLKSWICLPTNGSLLIKTLQECSGEEFMQWIDHLWPPAKGEHTAATYEKLENREKSYLYLVSMFQRMKFPKQPELEHNRPKKEDNSNKKKGSPVGSGGSNNQL